MIAVANEIERAPFPQCMSPIVCKVFGRRHDDPFHALWRPASKKRQGTKSREVGHRRCNGRYGDLMAESYGRPCRNIEAASKESVRIRNRADGKSTPRRPQLPRPRC
jgi:hypothetical protein